MIRLNDARLALHDALTLQSRGGGKLIRVSASTAPGWRDIEALTAAKINGATNRLAPLPKAWVQYAYAAEFSREAFELVHEALFDAISKGKIKRPTYRNCRRWMHLASAAMEDMQVRVLSRRAALTDAEISRRLAVRQDNYKRDWQAIWNAALDWLLKIDNEALAPVESQLADWRAAEEELRQGARADFELRQAERNQKKVASKI